MPAPDLYDALEPYQSGMLPVDSLHTLYWEQCGNPDGVPILFLHGGPGGACAPGHRRFFDPDHYRSILFDQRGAGRSTPFAEIRGNDTQTLVDDIEALRVALDVERWHVFGGSWGSTLALAYAQTHPERVLSLILRGVFLGRVWEIDWFLSGMGRFQPEAYQDFIGFLDQEERNDPLASYYARLCNPDPAIHEPAARAWAEYEARCATLDNNVNAASMILGASPLALSRIEVHYFMNAVFLQEAQLLNNAARLAGIPGRIIQGRYDCICPPTSAFELAEAWPDSELILLNDAGHSAAEPSIASALVKATNEFRAIKP